MKKLTMFGCAVAAVALMGAGLVMPVVAPAQAPAAQTPVLEIGADQVKGKSSPILHGLMTEEINYSYDGGLYAELIRNRALRPDLSVERTVLNRFRDVVAGNPFRTGQIGNCAGNFQDAVISAGAEVQVGHGEFQQLHRRLIQDAVAFYLTAAHAGVAGDFGLLPKARMLALARSDHPLANLRGRLAGLLAGDLVKLHRRHFDVQVNAVEQRAGDATEIVLNLTR